MSAILKVMELVRVRGVVLKGFVVSIMVHRKMDVMVSWVDKMSMNVLKKEKVYYSIFRVHGGRKKDFEIER